MPSNYSLDVGSQLGPEQPGVVKYSCAFGFRKAWSQLCKRLLTAALVHVVTMSHMLPCSVAAAGQTPSHFFLELRGCGDA